MMKSRLGNALTHLACISSSQLIAQVEPIWRAFQDAGYGIGAHVVMGLAGAIAFGAVIANTIRGGRSGGRETE